MVNNCLDLDPVKDPILFTPLQIGDGNRRGDLMTQNPIEIEHISAVERLIAKMRGEDFFCDSLSHILTP